MLDKIIEKLQKAKEGEEFELKIEEWSELIMYSKNRDDLLEANSMSHSIFRGFFRDFTLGYLKAKGVE